MRKIPKKIILDEEKDIVESGMKKYSSLEKYKIDVKKNIIQIYTPNQDVIDLDNLLKKLSSSRTVPKQMLNLGISYSPEIQFILIDKKSRIFETQRYCFLGKIDDWIDIGSPDSLDALVKKYIKHLGKESFFDLH